MTFSNKKILFILLTFDTKYNSHDNKKNNNPLSFANSNENTIRISEIPSYLLKHRIIYLSGEITDESSFFINHQLMYLSMEDPTKPIILYIKSFGGEVDSSLAIIDTIRSIKAPVYTVATGFVASAATLILSMGEKIYATKYANIMLHQPSTTFKGKVNDLMIFAEKMVKEKLIIIKIMFENINKNNKKKISFEEFMKLVDRDLCFDVKEAIELGLVHEELPPDFI